MRRIIPTLLLSLAVSTASLAQDYAVEVSGDLMQWHTVTLDITGPEASEEGYPNPFLDYRLTATFTHTEEELTYIVPGYFAADGNAADSGATSGNQWRVHLSPDHVGTWTYEISFVEAPAVAALLNQEGRPVEGLDGVSGSFEVAATDKKGRDFRAHGRIVQDGQYMKHAGTGQYVVKAGPDAPETFLGYEDFDNTVLQTGILNGNPAPLKSWSPHADDYNAKTDADFTWAGEGGPRGTEMIGALNYLAEEGQNVFSFLTYNAGGDGMNVWPHINVEQRTRFDVSKMAQWGRIFDHARRLGLILHFKTQEQENDNTNMSATGGKQANGAWVALDGGDMGIERSLYYRELMARFGHHLGVIWNLGEENTQTTEQQQAMAQFFKDHDPYGHLVVIHTFPAQQTRVYVPLLPPNSEIKGASVQADWHRVHRDVSRWLRESKAGGRAWVVASDEIGPAGFGVPPDQGYEDFDEADLPNRAATQAQVRSHVLWATLMAGGWGVEYYFGYQLPQNDLFAEDFRSRDRMWDYNRHALHFFHEQIPFWEMETDDSLVVTDGAERAYAKAKTSQVYAVYVSSAFGTRLDLSGAFGEYDVFWFNPRDGGDLIRGTVQSVSSGGWVDLGQPDSDIAEDWVILVKRKS